MCAVKHLEKCQWTKWIYWCTLNLKNEKKVDGKKNIDLKSRNIGHWRWFRMARMAIGHYILFQRDVTFLESLHCIAFLFFLRWLNDNWNKCVPFDFISNVPQCNTRTGPHRNKRIVSFSKQFFSISLWNICLAIVFLWCLAMFLFPKPLIHSFNHSTSIITNLKSSISKRQLFNILTFH